MWHGINIVHGQFLCLLPPLQLVLMKPEQRLRVSVHRAVAVCLLIWPSLETLPVHHTNTDVSKVNCTVSPHLAVTCLPLGPRVFLLVQLLSNH